MRKKVLRLLVFSAILLFWLQLTVMALPKGIIKDRMEISQQLREKNVYGKDIYQGIFTYTNKKNARGFIIPMITVYNKADNVILEAFTYLDYREITLIKGAYIQFYVYTPHIEEYDHHKIELYLADESNVTNYETVVATQALFAKEVSERRRTRVTASEAELELMNKHRRNLIPPLEPVTYPKIDRQKVKSDKKNQNNVDWMSPMTYGYKWGGFDKDDNFLHY